MGFHVSMEILAQHNVSTFKSRCPEIKLGQDVCHLVNTEFPHYSMTKLQPIFDKHIKKNKNPSAIMFLINRLYNDRPYFPDEAFYPNYFQDLFYYIKKHHSFNCQESSLLSALVLKLNGIENVYTAGICDGAAEIDHLVSFFNRDGSEYDGEIRNNQTIIVDPWTGLCNFANNIFKLYTNMWKKYFKISECDKGLINGKYKFTDACKMQIPKSNGFEDYIKDIYPNLVLKNS